MATVTAPHEPPLRVTPEADWLGRRIAVHVSAKRFGIAERILQEGKAKQRRRAEPDPIGPDTPLAPLGLAQQTISRLEAVGLLLAGEHDTRDVF